MELKRGIDVQDLRVCVPYNCTNMELKHGSGRSGRAGPSTYNCTNMELKRGIDVQDLRVCVPYNCTNMELKRQ